VIFVTGTEIKTKADLQLPKTTTDADALEAINEALGWLGDMGLVVGEITIEATANTFYTLPDDLTQILRVEDRATDEDNPYIMYNYRFSGNDIAFDEDGTYTIIARRMPSLGALANEIDIHPAFQRCLITHMRGWVKLKDDDESLAGLKLIEKFERDAGLVYSRLNNNGGPGQVAVIRHA
jgi:hypothetical protein